MKKIALSLLIVLALSSNVQPQTSFYQGKTIRVIVGYLPGDNHDIWARLYARLMGKHIPGNPDFIVQNMSGAGSMIAANHVYNLTKPDGLTLGSIGGALWRRRIRNSGKRGHRSTRGCHRRLEEALGQVKANLVALARKPKTTER